MKRGQNIGYQSYVLLFPETGQGIVVLTGSDNGTTLATALIRRAAVIYQMAAARAPARLTKQFGQAPSVAGGTQARFTLMTRRRRLARQP